jgi:hypothetical protein
MNLSALGKSPLILILLIGLLLRSWGVLFGLYHADEPIIVNHALAYGLGDLNPHFFAIPPLVSYYLFFGYGLLYALSHLVGLPDIAAFKVLFIEQPEIFYWWGRILVGVIPGTISIYAIYKLAQHLWSSEVANWAAFWLAINYLHIRNSHYIYVDICMLLAIIGCAYSALRAYDNKVLRSYIIAGMWIGLAAAIKYNAAIAACGLVFACAFSGKNYFKYLICAGFASILTYMFLNPFSVIAYKEFWDQLVHQAGAESMIGWVYHIKHSILSSTGIGVLILMACGILAAFKSDFKRTLILIAIPTAFFLMLGVFSQSHSRYALPLMPFIALAAGYGVQSLIHWSQFNKIFRIFVIALIIFSAAIPLVKTVQSNKLFLSTDTRDSAKQWIEQNIATDSKILFTHSFHRPKLMRHEAQWDQLLENAPQFNSAVNVKNRMLRELSAKTDLKYELFFLNDTNDPQFSGVWPGVNLDWANIKNLGIEYIVLHYDSTEHADYFDQVRAKSRLIKRFSPYNNRLKNYPFDTYASTFGFDSIRELFARHSTGRVLELYRVIT